MKIKAKSNSILADLLFRTSQKARFKSQNIGILEEIILTLY